MALFPSLINRGALAGCWARTASDSGGGEPIAPDHLLLESGDVLLLESGDYILLEAD